MGLWDLYQEAQIRNLRASSRMAEDSLRWRDERHQQRADELEERVDRLNVVLESLWSLCRDRLGLTDEQLLDAVETTIAEQQAELAAGPVRCPSCGAAIGAELDRCQFCGADSPREKSPFE
jgi:hypothetical protein